MNSITIYTISAESVRRHDLRSLEAAMPGRVRKASRYLFERDRLLSLGAGILLLECLGLKNESELEYTEYEKPYAPGYPAFNISHSGDRVILAVGGNMTGADIERIDPSHTDIAASVYTARELAWLAEEPLLRFFRLWVWKESVMKAAGLGMNLEPASFDVMPFVSGKPVELDGREWYARELALGDCRIAVCSDSPIEDVRLERIM